MDDSLIEIKVDLTEYYRNLHLSVTMEVVNYTVPLFLENAKAQLRFNGTGVFIKSENKYFLVTATHVVNLPGIKGIFTFGKENTLASLATASAKKRFADTSKDKRSDITIFELSTQILDQLDLRLKFLTEDNINLTTLTLDKSINYLAFGCPGNFADDPKRYQEVKLSYRGIVTQLSDFKWYEKHRYSPGDHILVDLPKFINDPDTGDRVRMFNPKGMSGGGLWQIPKQTFPPNPIPYYLLTGILIEQELNGHRCMASTNIIKVFEFMKSGFGAIFKKDHDQNFTVVGKL